MKGFPDGSVVKNSPANVEDRGSIPGPGKSHIWATKPIHHNYKACAL